MNSLSFVWRAAALPAALLGLGAAAEAATHSSTIVLAPNDKQVWSVNPDNDSVSVFDGVGDTLTRERAIPVGDNPQSVAINSAGTAVFVVNTGSNSVSVINAATRTVVDTVLNVGFEPYGAALTPDGKFLYVACASSSNVYKIDVINNFQILQTIAVPGANDLRGVAISDDSKTVYVTQLLAELRTGVDPVLGQIDDDGKQGVVYPINVSSGSSDTVGTKIALVPMSDSGFKGDRSRYCTATNAAAVNNTFCPDLSVTDPNDPRVKTAPQGAYQNVIQNIVIVGNRAFVPSLGTAPEPPVRFNLNVQALFTTLDLTPGGGTFKGVINMNSAVAAEAVSATPLNKVFFSMPWAFAVHPDATNPLDPGYAVIQGGNMVVKLYDIRKGTPTVVGPDGIVRIPVGKDPRGIALNKTGSRAYVQNLISRDITVINLLTDTVLATVQSADLPAPGSQAATALLGKELFNTSLGPLASDPNFAGRYTMSDNGWGSCFNCHPFGLADGATWSFPNGPRQTIPLDGTVSQTNTDDQRILNWTAVRSTVQDFEKNTENVSGGFGLIGPFGATDGVVDHGANRGLDERWDAIEDYVKTIAAPRAVRNTTADVGAGRAVFIAEGCQNCHGGGKWSKSLLNYTLPAGSVGGEAVVIGTGTAAPQILSVGGIDVLEDVASFNASGPIEVRGAGGAQGTLAQGAQGFNVPSLLGAFRHTPYFRDGRFSTLRQVIDSGHENAGLSVTEKNQLEAFLKTIDDTTPPILADVDILSHSDHNSPIQFSPDERYVFTANPDNNSMSVVYVAGGETRLVTEVDVGREPRSVAAHPDNRRVFVANQADGSISVIQAPDWTVVKTITGVATEPYGLAMTRDGKKLLVTGAGSNEVVVVDVDPASGTNETVIHRVDLLTEIVTAVGVNHPLRKINFFNPRGITISADDEAAVVTLFLAQNAASAPIGEIEGFDSGNSGYALLLDLRPNGVAQPPAKLINAIELPFLADTGFRANRKALCTAPIGAAVNDTFCPDPGNPDPNAPVITSDPQGAYPNLLQSVALIPYSSIVNSTLHRIYFPSIGSSPEPPVAFNFNVQALVSTGGLTTADAPDGAQIPQISYGNVSNLNRGINFETASIADYNNGILKKIFFSTLWDLRFKQLSGSTAVGFAIAAGSDVAVRVLVNPNSNSLSIGAPADANDPGSVVRVKLGKNPRGLVISGSGARMFSYNEVGRSVTGVDISNDQAPVVLGETVVARRPEPGTPAADVLLGKELFNAGLGPVGLAVNDPNDPNTVAFGGRFTMSDNGWGNCFNCHPFGLSDGVTWIFANGPRQTIPLDSTFSKTNRTDQRILNWTAVRSSVQDFEKNTENVSGGFGLIGPRGATDGVRDHLANRGRDPRADAINEYVKTIRPPIGVPGDPNTIAAGQAVFDTLRCWTCHGSGKWSTSFVNYPLPAVPDPNDPNRLVNIDAGAQVLSVNGISVLQNVGSFDPSGPIEIRANGALAQGTNGFNPPSVLGIGAHGPYFHDGRFVKLEDLFLGATAPHFVADGTQRLQLAAFLKNVSEATADFPVTDAFDPNTAIQPSINSSPIAVTSNGLFVVSVNPDNNSVSVFNTTTDTRVGEFPVGKSPRSVAINPANNRVYVTNQKDGTVDGRLGTVSVLEMDVAGNLSPHATTPSLSVGAEPYGCALTPNGKFLFVANMNSGTITVIRTDQLTVARTIDVKTNPRSVAYPAGIAITDDGDGDDADEKVYVTLFLALLSEGGYEGFDQGKEGHVVVIHVGADDGASDTKVIRTMRLPGMKDTGFKASRLAFRKENGAVNNTFAGTGSEAQGGFPNLIQSAFIRGNRVFFPSLGSQPEPPVGFNFNVQAFVTPGDTVHDTVAQQTLNMNAGVANDPDNTGNQLDNLFFSAPWQLAIRTDTPSGKVVGYTVVSGGNVIVRTEFDKDGDPTINAAKVPVVTSPIKRIEVGKNPQGIVILPNNTKAYVMNYISRNVSVVNLSTEAVTSTIQSAALPAPGSAAETALLGKELFNASRGPLASDPNFPGRFTMSDNGWGSCFNCHPLGLADGVTWIFPDGPRQTIPLDGTFGADDANTGSGGFIAGLTQKILNYGAVRTAIQDFEKNTEGVSGGFGLIGVRGAGDGVADHKANRGLDSRADAIEAYVSTIEAPISPVTALAASTGRTLFLQAGCDDCHSGSIWTTSRAAYDLPASADPDVVFSNNTAKTGSIVRINGQTRSFLQILHNVGSFNLVPSIEIRGAGGLVGKTAGGADGFNVPSLLGIAAQAPYFHDGKARDLEEVMENVAHRTAGQPAGSDIFAGSSGPQNIADVVLFVKSVGEFTQVVQQPAATIVLDAIGFGMLVLTAAALMALTVRRVRRKRPA